MVELFNDNFQNFKGYQIPKAQLIISDIPYNLGANAYGSDPRWYIGGDNKNGESTLAGKSFFRNDGNFNIAEFFHFASKLLKKEPKKLNDAPAMIVFCAFQQFQMVISYAAKHGFKNYYPMYFIKNTSPQVLKANMKIVGAVETALVFYRDKLPKFRNNGRMILNWMNWYRDDNNIHRIHPTQKPVNLLKNLIRIFTDAGDVVIDPCAGSGSTLRACLETNRNGFGFEINKDFFNAANSLMLKTFQPALF